MQGVSNEQAQNIDHSMSSSDDSTGRFNREIRLTKNSCPLCSFVQTEVGKGNPIPVEEWIYLTHLRNVHGIEQ